MYLDTLSTDFFKALATNSTATSFASLINTITEPTGDGVINFANRGITVPTLLELSPFGVGDDNDEFSMRVTSWRRYGNDPETWLWKPKPLLEVACVMCASVGVAGSLLGATTRFCDAISIVGTIGSAGESCRIITPGSDLEASILLDIQGAQKIQFTFDMTTGSPTNANCLYALCS
jgi:hypothetical protein